MKPQQSDKALLTDNNNNSTLSDNRSPTNRMQKKNSFFIADRAAIERAYAGQDIYKILRNLDVVCNDAIEKVIESHFRITLINPAKIWTIEHENSYRSHKQNWPLRSP